MKSQNVAFIVGALICTLFVPAISQSADDWVEIKDPAELRALYSNKTIRGTAVTSNFSFVAHFSADGRGILMQGDKKIPRTWAIKGNDQVCITDVAGTNCWGYWRQRDNRSLIKVMNIENGWTYTAKVEDGIPPFDTAAASTAPAAAAADPPLEDLYRSQDAWLCRPGRQDICAGDQSSTIIARDGSMTRESWKPDPAAPIDCFYVYPTISDDPRGNSSLIPGTGEKRAVEQQFARFASVCRPYAPMYRQITIAALRSLFAGNPIPMDAALGYRDVLAAWKDYLKFDNQGRGVVLIGHSQGSRMLVELMRREIDGNAVQSHLVSALILGFNLEVPKGSDVGGTFKQIPLCRSASQTGCVVAHVSFRESSPPPANALYGRAKTPNTDVACTDPVALSGVELRSYIPVRSNLLGQGAIQEAWIKMATQVETPFVSLPGLINAKCVNDGQASYLAVSLHPGPQDARPADIPGDMVSGGKILDNWGIHMIDVNVAMGNLLNIVRGQSAAYLSKNAKQAKSD